MQPMRPRFATLSMRTATAVSKCVLTSPGSSTVLATASCDARFALAQKKKQKPKAAPRSRPSSALCSLSTRSLGMNARLKTPLWLCTGLAQLNKLLLLAVLRALSGRLEPRKFALASL